MPSMLAHTHTTNVRYIHVRYKFVIKYCGFVIILCTTLVHTLATKLLSRKMLAGPANRAYLELLVAEAWRKE